MPVLADELRRTFAHLIDLVERSPANDTAVAAARVAAAALVPPPARAVGPKRRIPLTEERREHLSRVRSGRPIGSAAAGEKQLRLRLWPEDRLRGCLDAYIEVSTEKLAHASIHDYECRADWLCQVLGAYTPITDVTYPRLERLIKEQGPKGRGLKLVTLRKRIRFLRAALRLQVDRGALDPHRLWKMPRQLHDDGERGQDLYTVEEYLRFREHVPEGRYRRYFDLAFWTGHHTYDLQRTHVDHMDPDFTWIDENGVPVGHGRYWRRNHKNRRCADTWLPMQPEFRAAVVQMLELNPQWRASSAICGKLAGTTKVARLAAEAAGLHYVTPNRGMRRSFATMLAARGHDPEFIRQAMAHEGRMIVSRESAESTPRTATHRPTMDTAHYLRPSHEMLVASIKRAAR